MKKALTWESIAEWQGGLVKKMLEKELDRTTDDTIRGFDSPDWREVTLKIRTKPITAVDADGLTTLQDVAVEFSVGKKTPQRSAAGRMMVGNHNEIPGRKQLYFELDAPDNPHQKSLLDEQK